MSTKKSLVTKAILLEGKKSSVKLADGMEFQTIVEALLAAMRLAEHGSPNLVCEAELSMHERITKIALKAKKKLDKKK